MAGLEREVTKVPSHMFRQYIENYFPARETNRWLWGFCPTDNFIDRCEASLRACYPVDADPGHIDLCLAFLVVEQRNSAPQMAPLLPRKFIEALLRELQHQYKNESMTKCPLCNRRKKELVYTDDRVNLLRQFGHVSKKRTAPKIVDVLRAFRAAPQEFTYKDIMGLGNNSIKENTVRSVFNVLEYFGEVINSSPGHAGAKRITRYKTKEFGKSDIWKLEYGTGEVQWQYFQGLISKKTKQGKSIGTELDNTSESCAARRTKKQLASPDLFSFFDTLGRQV